MRHAQRRYTDLLIRDLDGHIDDLARSSALSAPLEMQALVDELQARLDALANVYGYVPSATSSGIPRGSTAPRYREGPGC